jgi:FAD dependent oxidoreductase TIGR03364
MKRKAIVIGAGIVGLATARALAVRGYHVTVIERNIKASGASVRNFGMVWPIGQPDGELFESAMVSRSIWMQICNETGMWNDPVGSLHVAYEEDEMNVLRELAEVYGHRNYEVLDGQRAIDKSSFVKENGLKGALFSSEELIVDPREALMTIPEWLSSRFEVQFIWGKAVTDIAYPSVCAAKEEFEADVICVCSGADFETLYPRLFAEQQITKCKLQMMRLVPPGGAERIGAALCGGLSLVHYRSFTAAPSLNELKKRFESEYPEYLKWGIHVMAAQNEAGEITIGDSHEYGLSPDPFDKKYINDLVLAYLSTFATFSGNYIYESWNGVYAKLTDGNANLVLNPEEGVTIINGLGGAGMTLSFGMCDEVVKKGLNQIFLKGA